MKVCIQGRPPAPGRFFPGRASPQWSCEENCKEWGLVSTNPCVTHHRAGLRLHACLEGAGAFAGFGPSRRLIHDSMVVRGAHVDFKDCSIRACLESLDRTAKGQPGARLAGQRAASAEWLRRLASRGPHRRLRGLGHTDLKPDHAGSHRPGVAASPPVVRLSADAAGRFLAGYPPATGATGRGVAGCAVLRL